MRDQMHSSAVVLELFVLSVPTVNNSEKLEAFHNQMSVFECSN